MKNFTRRHFKVGDSIEGNFDRIMSHLAEHGEFPQMALEAPEVVDVVVRSEAQLEDEAQQ